MKKLLLWGIPALLLLSLIGWRFVVRGKAQAQVSRQSAVPRTAAVEVVPTTSRVILQSLQSVGNIESPLKVEISPKTAGRIEFLEAREGDVVTPGQVLLKIDPSDLKGALLQQIASAAEARSRLAQARMTQGANNVGVSSQIKQQQAGLGSAQANYNQVQQNYSAQVASAQAQVSAAQSAVANAQAGLEKENFNLANAQTKYDRTYNLYKQGFAAAQDVDDAKTTLDVEKGSVDVAKAGLDAAKSQLNVQQQNLLITKRKGLSDVAASRAALTQSQATLQLANANRSQVSAYVQNLEALQSQVDAAVAQVNQAQSKLGDTVIRSNIAGTVTARKADPGGLASPGTPVLEVQYLDWLYVTTTLPIEASSEIHSGQEAQITIDALPGQNFKGAITNINPAADAQSRQFSIKVRLDNKDHVIKPGMYARVTIVTNRVNAEVVVPREAIKTDASGVTTVTVVDKDKVAHVKTVKVGASDEKSCQILEGVEPGDKVVVLTYTPVKDGQKVSIGDPNAAKGGGKGGKARGGGSGRGQAQQ